VTFYHELGDAVHLLVDICVLAALLRSGLLSPVKKIVRAAHTHGEGKHGPLHGENIIAVFEEKAG
jgi:hypothetical protein